MRRRRPTALLCLVLLVASCGARAEQPGGTPATYDGEWWLVSGEGPEGRVRTNQPSDATMTIEGNGERVYGTAVCNMYDGKAQIDGEIFRPTGFSGTEMGCVPAWRHDAEAAFIAALGNIERIQRDGSDLTLTGPDAKLRFKFHPQPPPPTLESTRWKLNGLVQGRGPEGSVSSVDRASLQLNPDGTLRGTTGCRRFTGTWEESDGRVTVGSFEVSGNCNGDEHQDAQVVQVLSGGFDYEIRDQNLDVFQPDGELGLTYTTGLR